MNSSNRPPVPPPTAQLAPFVQVLGLEGAIRFILAYGGAELDIRANPREGNELVKMFGLEAVEALANTETLPRRIPLAKPWLAVYFHAKGLSIAQIARKLRISDMTVRSHLRRDTANRERLRADAERREQSHLPPRNRS